MTFAEIIRYSELHPAGNDPVFVRLREIAELVVRYNPGLKNSFEYDDAIEDLETEVRNLQSEVECWEQDHQEKCIELEEVSAELKSLKLDMLEELSQPLFKKERDMLRSEIYDLTMEKKKNNDTIRQQERTINELRREIKNWEEKYQTWTAISG